MYVFRTYICSVCTHIYEWTPSHIALHLHVYSVYPDTGVHVNWRASFQMPRGDRGCGSPMIHCPTCPLYIAECLGPCRCSSVVSQTSSSVQSAVLPGARCTLLASVRLCMRARPTLESPPRTPTVPELPSSRACFVFRSPHI